MTSDHRKRLMPTYSLPIDRPTVPWPEKRDLFGVSVSVCELEEATRAVMTAARARRPSIVSCFSVHALVTASDDPALNAKANSFDMITADGQPVRWALNLLQKSGLQKRVCGRDLVDSVCTAAAEEGISVYLYGGRPDVVSRLESALSQSFPGLTIAGAESPPFRELTADEDRAVIERINASGAGIVLIGLGCPKQDHFAYAHRPQIHAVQICVGAVFDFFAGSQPIAPQWMQDAGLEWLFRLGSEPRRLFARYAVTNTAYLLKLVGGLAWPRPAAREASTELQTHSSPGVLSSPAAWQNSR